MALNYKTPFITKVEPNQFAPSLYEFYRHAIETHLFDNRWGTSVSGRSNCNSKNNKIFVNVDLVDAIFGALIIASIVYTRNRPRRSFQLNAPMLNMQPFKWNAYRVSNITKRRKKNLHTNCTVRRVNFSPIAPSARFFFLCKERI